MTVVAGVVVVALAALLLVDVAFEWALPAVLAGAGLVLVASGLARGR